MKTLLITLALATAAISDPMVGEWKIIESTCNPVTVMVNGKEAKTVLCQATRDIVDTVITPKKAK